MAKIKIERSPLKDKPRRNPGQSLDEQITQLIYVDFSCTLLIFFYFLVITLLEWGRLFKPFPPQPLTFTVITLCILLYTIRSLRKTKIKVNNLRLGRDGEKATGQFLEKLRSRGCMVYHDIICGNFNLDHVIISEKGIFLIETKTYSKSPTGKNFISYKNGKLLINGYESLSNPIEQVSSSARYLSEIILKETGIKQNIESMIVFPGWFIEDTIIHISKGILVTNPKILPNIIYNKQSIIDKENVRKIASGLSRYIRRTEVSIEKLKKA